MPEERACLGKFCKNAFVQEEFVFISINNNFGFFRSILVVYNKVKIPKIFAYAMDQSQVGTAFSALKTFERDCTRLLVPYWTPVLKKSNGSQLIYLCHTIFSLTHG